MYRLAEATGMRFYYTGDDEPEILERGFRDGEDVQLADRIARGVWLSELPETVVEANGSLLELELPADLVARFETATEGSCVGRTFLVPASVANRARIVRSGASVMEGGGLRRRL
jgi:hypothetical protein